MDSQEAHFFSFEWKLLVLPVSHSHPHDHELTFYAPGMLRFMYNTSAALQGGIFPTKYPPGSLPHGVPCPPEGWMGERLGRT